MSKEESRKGGAGPPPAGNLDLPLFLIQLQYQIPNNILFYLNIKFQYHFLQYQMEDLLYMYNSVPGLF